MKKIIFKDKFLTTTLVAVILFFVNDAINDFMLTGQNDIHFYFELSFVVVLIILLITQFRKNYHVTGQLHIAKNKLTLIEEGL